MQCCVRSNLVLASWTYFPGFHQLSLHHPFSGRPPLYSLPGNSDNIIHCNIAQWFQSLFRCKIATLNFSMGINIMSPYMDCVTHTWICASVSYGDYICPNLSRYNTGPLGALTERHCHLMWLMCNMSKPLRGFGVGLRSSSLHVVMIKVMLRSIPVCSFSCCCYTKIIIFLKRDLHKFSTCWRGGQWKKEGVYENFLKKKWQDQWWLCPGCSRAWRSGFSRVFCILK